MRLGFLRLGKDGTKDITKKPVAILKLFEGWFTRKNKKDQVWVAVGTMPAAFKAKPDVAALAEEAILLLLSADVRGTGSERSAGSGGPGGPRGPSLARGPCSGRPRLRPRVEAETGGARPTPPRRRRQQGPPAAAAAGGGGGGGGRSGLR